MRFLNNLFQDTYKPKTSKIVALIYMIPLRVKKTLPYLSIHVCLKTNQFLLVANNTTKKLLQRMNFLPWRENKNKQRLVRRLELHVLYDNINCMNKR